MKMKRTVLIFVSSYIPAFKAGGPIQSISNMVDQLGDDVNFRIITRDRDTGDKEAFPGIVTGEWLPCGKAKVMYLSEKNQTLRMIRKIITSEDYDLIYLNSFFHFRSTILPLVIMRFSTAFVKPILLAPRGEFSSGALKIKRTRKKLYINFSKMFGLYKNVVWHASTKYEKNDIVSIFKDKIKIRIASDLSRKYNVHSKYVDKRKGEPLKLVFLSRIVRMKNLRDVIKVLSSVSVPVNLDIYGPIEDHRYWEECQRLVKDLPQQIIMSYRGVVSAPQVPEVLSGYDLFFFPTFGENFGHVIIEALSAGTPVLISDQTPWVDLADYGCGWTEPLGDLNAFAKRIESMFYEDMNNILYQRQRALEYGRNFNNNESLVSENLAMFSSVMGISWNSEQVDPEISTID